LAVTTLPEPSRFTMLRHHAGRALRRMAETLDPAPTAPVIAPLETC
jgi:hypothetical protein